MDRLRLLFDLLCMLHGVYVWGRKEGRLSASKKVTLAICMHDSDVLPTCGSIKSDTSQTDDVYSIYVVGRLGGMGPSLSNHYWKKGHSSLTLVPAAFSTGTNI